MAQVAVLFLTAYLAGVCGLVYFDLSVLGLGDPLLKIEPGLIMALWSVFYLPAAITGIVFLRRSQQQGPSLVRLAAVYLALTLLALEVSFVLHIPWPVLLLEVVVLGLWFRLLMPARVLERPPASLRPVPQIFHPLSDAPIDFTCNRCHAPIHSVYAQHGRMMACPSCSKQVMIPRKSNALQDRA